MNRFLRLLVVGGTLLSLNVPLFATRLVTYHFRGEIRLGALHEDDVIDLNRAYYFLLNHLGKTRARARAAALVPPDIVEFLQGEDDSLHEASRALDLVKEVLTQTRGRERLEDAGVLLKRPLVRLGAVVPNPPHVLAVGLNYREHARETGRDLPEYPVIFTKEGRVIGPGEQIVIPSGVERPDYEVELAVVVGKRASNLTRENALEHVAGYTVFNDVTARGVQRRTSQWTLGKSPDTFSAMGAQLVLRDEIPDPQILRLSTRIGDDVLQDANTSDMIFSVIDILVDISQYLTLEPGSVIVTGTPSGVGAARNPPRFLQHGEIVTVEIEKIGRLDNPVVRQH